MRALRKVPDLGWKLALWASFCTIAAVFSFGAAVDVEFIDPSVGLTEAWQSTDWHQAWRALVDHEYRIIWLIAAQAMGVCTFHRSPWFRLAAVAIGLLVPAAVISPTMFGVALVSPMMAIAALAGEMDGEFYQEGMMIVAACGLWMLLCGVVSVREARLLVGRRRSGWRAAGTLAN